MTRAATPTPDVAVVGDGPAGLAVAAAANGLGLDVVVHGTGEPWHATYATWRDDVAWLPDTVFVSVVDRVEVHGTRRHVIDRDYAVFDNDALRAHLASGLRLRTGRVDPVDVTAGVVIDATGASGRPRAWQTAHGVVLDRVPPSLGVSTDRVTLMDWRPAGGELGDTVPSFCYVVPVADGWLIEETVLAASPVVEPAALRDRLVCRLGRDGARIVDGARRTEEVRIPMGAPPVRPSGPYSGSAVVPFGAAAGYVHPATGYSVAASLRAAPRVARAIADGLDLGAAVWPGSHLRARALHDYGLDALLRLRPTEVAAFFDAFFELPVEVWSDYLRVDTTPRAVAGVMRRVFRRAPWSLRARLMTGDPRPVVRDLAASRSTAERPAPIRAPRRSRR